MFHLEKIIQALADKFNWVAAGAVVAMMVLTSADVVLRLFRHPIPGTYEMVGLLGAVVVSFSLAYTSIQKGHIAVEFIVQKLPAKGQALITVVNDFLGFALFALIAWQSVLYALDLTANGEVSLTLQMPIYPFVYGVAIGCGFLSFLLLFNFFKSLQGIGET